ncbi:MAG: ammonia-forming cytochrome c nitrite reductase subunit c552 [Vicinamibacteria bacterium]
MTVSRGRLVLVGVALASALAAFLVAGLLTSIFERKQEARNPYVRLVEVNEETTDPAPWGMNWPRELEAYRRTADNTHTQYGGSEALPAQKIERDPWLKRMFAGYAFSIDYRDRRGHAFMLSDQEATKRVTERPQPGSCLHCHASVIPTYRRLGGGDVFQGFEALGKLSYAAAHAEVVKTGTSNPVAGVETRFQHADGAHPVSCVDCHDPQTMALRVTRPGFIRGIQALAQSAEPVPHLPSVERWRQGGRAAPYDPNADGTRQEMRSYVCGQCHVEYYCGPKTTLFFPWDKGLKVEQIESHYDGFKFPDGHRFYDWSHAETGAEVLKAQHPEFELWSQGVHARSGVACADCHMPYTREGAVKVADHWVRSPLLNIARSCQSCHPYPEAELQARVDAIQGRTQALMQRSASALVDMLDAMAAAKRDGVPSDRLAAAQALQRKAQWRLDFVAAENSMGFHAPAEAARILGESIDYSRQAQLALQGARTEGAQPPAH